MSIKINSVRLNQSQKDKLEIPSISIKNLKDSNKAKFKIVAKTDSEGIPGPNKHTVNQEIESSKDEFHFLKTIIIDNELY